MASSQLIDEAITVSTIYCFSLVELNKPYLKNLAVASFAALKTLLAIAGTVVWVTSGSTKDNPSSGMTKGIINTVKTGHPNLSKQIYDFDGTVSPSGGIK